MKCITRLKWGTAWTISAMLIFACIILWLLLFFKNHNFSSFPKKDDNIVTKAILYMRENLGQRLWIDDIAAKFSYSASHFSSLFAIRLVLLLWTILSTSKCRRHASCLILQK